MKYLALVLLFVGESASIYAEELGARLYSHSTSFGTTFLHTLIPVAIGACCLVIAYMLGLKYVHNIWIISAVSFGSILLVEPLFDFFYIGQTPELGAGIGMLCGVLGILAALFL